MGRQMPGYAGIRQDMPGHAGPHTDHKTATEPHLITSEICRIFGYKLITFFFSFSTERKVIVEIGDTVSFYI